MSRWVQGAASREGWARRSAWTAVRVAVACVFVLNGTALASASTFTFDDIEFWVGSGVNRAAVAIDWLEAAADPPALVWGFRWDGSAHGDDMLMAVLTADVRLFAKLGGTPANPVAVYGLGYDANHDGEFGLDDGTAFNAAGVAITDESDGAVSVDAADRYAEGWYTGVWHYGIAASNPFEGGAWEDSPRGMSIQPLVDGGWNSWTYSPSFNFASFAMNPAAAASPFPPGDYDRNGEVNTGDYTRWKDRFGTHDSAVDGNRNGVVDAADYTIWRNNLGASWPAAAHFTAPHAVPEPNAAMVVLLTLLGLIAMNRARR